jgi:hypothetical protein
MWQNITVQDVAAFYSGKCGHIFQTYSDLTEIAKDTGTVNSQLIPEYRNRVYGARIWTQLNEETNVFGVLPKFNWDISGWRVKTDFATTADAIAIGETDNIPDPVYPSIKTVYADPRANVIDFEISETMDALAGLGKDDVYGSADQIRDENAKDYRKMINRQLMALAIGKDTTGVDSVADDGKSFYSLDRIVSSADEASAYSATGKENVFNIDKSVDTWANSIVKYDTTGQDLTEELVRSSLFEAKAKGANTNMMITGWDCYSKLVGLYMNYVNYFGQVVPQGSTEGLKVAPAQHEKVSGGNFGETVATIYGVPVIPTSDAPKEGDGYISRLFMLDTTDAEGINAGRLGLSVLRPVEYFETRDIALMKKLAVRGVYRMIGQVCCRFFAGQVKVRDLLA